MTLFNWIGFFYCLFSKKSNIKLLKKIKYDIIKQEREKRGGMRCQMSRKTQDFVN